MSIRFSAKVRDLSHKGLGVIDHPDGRVFFVRGVWPGDEGEFEVLDGALRYDEAKLIAISTLSPDRVPVSCPYRGSEPGTCGGCTWMMGSYETQLRFKVKRLEHSLEKRGVRLSSDILRSIIPSPKQLQYRNRAQFKTDGKKLGYVSEGSNVFAPVNECLILNEKLEYLFHQVRESLPRNDLMPGEGHQWSYIDLDDELLFENVKANRRRPFRQGNTLQNQRMKEWVAEKFKQLPTHFPVIDLFCGSGNFTEVLSELGFTNILAVEVQGVALEQLKARHLPGVRILELDVTQKGSWAQVARHQPHAKAMLVDPPREGIVKRRNFQRYLDNLQHLFYISCELDTFARDTEDLLRKGWELKELTPLDLFPHTPHVEMLSELLLRR